MREILWQIGRRPDGGEKERQPKFPLGDSQRTLIEEKCTQGLEKRNFGKSDFRKFCKNMFALARNEGDLSGDYAYLDYAYLSVPREEKSVAINNSALAIFDGLKPDPSYKWHFERNNRWVNFENLGKHGLLSLADTRVLIPDKPNTKKTVTYTNPLSYLQAQGFCKEVFDLYLESSERKDFVNQ